ncbi:MAG: galactose mutarotase [Ruminococcaceae bacterium]|nr:galactose mutarotase [Oscillospiraceae bacterium]
MKGSFFMAVERVFFGEMPDGREVYKYIITNSNDYSAHILTLGATLQSFFAEDKNGEMQDVLLCFDNVKDHLELSDYQGVVVGPVCNRIGGASFDIGDKHYNLTANEKGITCLHSGGELGNELWKAMITDSDRVEFSYTASDLSHGFPGEKDIKVTYKLDDDNALHIKYEAVATKDTYLNFTNHAYFNLNGFKSGDILSHSLVIDADLITEVDENSIPTGKNIPVEGTAFDFRCSRIIGKDIDDEHIQLQYTGGYDHNFCINNYDGKLREFAQAEGDISGIKMNVYTTLPGVQFYAGNFLKGIKGKDAHPMEKRSGFCLETQFYPDTPNNPSFPSCLFKTGEKYVSETVYRFSL